MEFERGFAIAVLDRQSVPVKLFDCSGSLVSSRVSPREALRKLKSAADFKVVGNFRKTKVRYIREIGAPRLPIGSLRPNTRCSRHF